MLCSYQINSFRPPAKLPLLDRVCMHLLAQTDKHTPSIVNLDGLEMVCESRLLFLPVAALLPPTTRILASSWLGIAAAAS